MPGAPEPLPRFPRPSVFGRIVLPIIVGVAIVAAAGWRIMSSYNPSGRDVSTLILAIVVFIGIVVVLIMMTVYIMGLGERRRARDIVKLRPGAFVFASVNSDQLHDALAMRGYDRPFNDLFDVALTDAAIELWRDDGGAEPAVVIPWTEVRGVQPGMATLQKGTSQRMLRAVHLMVGTAESPRDIPIVVSGSLSRADSVLEQFAERVAR